MGFSERTASLVIFVNLFVKSYRVCTEGEIYRHTHRSYVPKPTELAT